MIEFEILSSPDQDILGTHIYQKSMMTVGRSLQNDLIILDDHIHLRHLEIKLDKKIHIDAPDSCIFYYSGKKIIEGIIYKLGEEIKIGSTVFKITKHIPNPKVDLLENFRNQYEEIELERPTLIDVLQNIELELKVIERDRYVK